MWLFFQRELNIYYKLFIGMYQNAGPRILVSTGQGKDGVNSDVIVSHRTIKQTKRLTDVFCLSSENIDEEQEAADTQCAY